MTTPTWTVLAGRRDDRLTIIEVTSRGAELSRRTCGLDDLGELIRNAPTHRRWVWNDSARWYPPMIADGDVIARCHDLRLCHAILQNSALVADAAPLRAAAAWSTPLSAEQEDGGSPALFGWDEADGVPDDPDEVLAEFVRQQTAVAESRDPHRLRLLLAAESAGALIAAELHAAGLPWDAAVHERLLTELLGPAGAGGLPENLRTLADEVRTSLGDATVSLDSPPKLLRALHRAGIPARTTSRWELADYDHPAVRPLIAYKRLMRLHTANGRAWLDTWARGGRFRPVYVPGGVVTGRWASSGGGALQIPRQLRAAVRADPGWTLVVADVAQLEPRVLAGMARDTALADAARGADLYAGIVADGVIATRQEAKVAVLGAMYGATTGDSGRLVPALRRAYPRAMGLVDDAARIGEDGGVVSTWLGRTSPAPSDRWREIQARAAVADATPADESAARRWARDRGRFTRNFVVQGTAAEWALAWLADLRARLAALPAIDETVAPAAASGGVFSQRPHLAFFLHDEIIVHTPESSAPEVADLVRRSAESAARLLFGDFPLDFPLDLRIGADAAKT